MNEQKKVVKVGVLALQDSFREHLFHLENLFGELVGNRDYSQYEFKACKVKAKKDLDSLNGIIICGGESTTITILLQRTTTKSLLNPFREIITKRHLPAWGTCCGLILLSNHIENNKSKIFGDMKYECIGGLNVIVSRNSFERQLESFTQTIDLAEVTNHQIRSFEGVFIRAPTITTIDGNDGTKILSTVTRDEHTCVIGAMDRTALETSFHPEPVDGDYRFHKWFLDKFVLKNLDL